MDIICKICNNSASNSIYKVKEMQFGIFDEFFYMECSNCACLQLINIPFDMQKFYPGDYYSLKKKLFSETKLSLIDSLKKYRDYYSIFRKGYLGYFINYFYPTNLDILSRANIKLESKILDVGCGSGTLLSKLSLIGFKNLFGVDPYISDDIIDEHISIFKKEIFELNGKFDIIMLHHSFEHMSEPLKVLNKCYDLLNDNGFIIIRIPTTSSWAWKNYKENWVNLDAPRHIFLHSINSMRYLCSLSRLNIKEIIYDSTPMQFWGSEQYKKGIPLNSKNSLSFGIKNSIFSKKELKYFKKKASDLNKKQLGDTLALLINKVKI